MSLSSYSHLQCSQQLAFGLSRQALVLVSLVSLWKEGHQDDAILSAMQACCEAVGSACHITGH